MWEQFRRRYFPGERINLNPGTLGTPSTLVRERMERFREGELASFPLGQYRRGREAIREVRALAARLWHTTPESINVPLAVTQGCTFTMGLVTLALHGHLQSRNRFPAPFRVLATQHEHHGGIGGFLHHPGFAVSHLPDAALGVEGGEILQSRVREVAPAIILLSQITWTEGRILPLAQMVPVIRAIAPDAWIILDLAQGTGLLRPPVELCADGAADLMVTSAHKWLNGPPGTGFLWASPRARDSLGGLQWAGEPLDPDSPLGRFEPAGGQDFAVWAGLAGALQLRENVGESTIAARSAALARHFMGGLADSIDMEAAGLAFCEPARVAGTLCLSFAGRDPYPIYARLNDEGVHTKCIKTRLPDGRELNLLRFGFPFYESEARVGEAAGRIAEMVNATS